MSDFDDARGGRSVTSCSRWAPQLAGVALAFVLAGCTSPSAPSGSVSTPAVTLPMSSATAVDAATQGALGAYRGMWRAYAAAGAAGATSSPDLTHFASGEALDALRIALRTIADGGLVLRGEAVPSPRVRQLTPPSAPTEAVIVDCLDDRNFTRVKASPGGAPFSDSPGGFRSWTATVTAMDGTWKVTFLKREESGTCQPG